MNQKAKLSPLRSYEEIVPIAPTKTLSALVAKLKSSGVMKQKTTVNATEMLDKILAGVGTSEKKRESSAPSTAAKHSSAENSHSLERDRHSPGVDRSPSLVGKFYSQNVLDSTERRSETIGNNSMLKVNELTDQNRC